MTTTSAAPNTAPGLGTMLVLEVRDEMRMIRREPATLFFSVVMPVAFYAMFVGMFGGESSLGGRPAGTTMLATFGGYGAMMATALTPGIGLATNRESGWLEAIRVSPVPVSVAVAAKVVATLPYVVGILVAMTVTSAAMGVLEIAPVEWLLLVAALVIGCLPFALVGLTVGALATPNASTAILNAILIPAAVAGGMWFPLEMLPGWIANIAPALPSYHLAQLAAAPLEGGSWLGHVIVLLAFTAIGGLTATVAWGRAPR